MPAMRQEKFNDESGASFISDATVQPKNGHGKNHILDEALIFPSKTALDYFNEHSKMSRTV